MNKCSIVLALILTLSSCNGGDVAGAATLGFALNGFADRIETVVRTAGEHGRGVVVQAGTEAYIAIQAAKVAYEDSLNKSVDKLDATTTRKLQEIQTMVNDLESNVDDKIATVTGQAQQIANTLPFANTTPQLTSFRPKFHANTATPGQLELEMRGNFMFAHRDDLKPTLQMADRTYEPAENTTQSLKFLTTPPSTTVSDNKITLTKLRLIMPYEEKRFLLFKSRKEGTYDLLLGTLPPSPGKVTLSKKNVTETTETQHVVTQTWQQHSSNDDHKDVVYEGPSHPGWTIVDGSVRFVVEWNQGDENDEWSKTFIRANPSVVFRVTTIHHSIGTSGKVNFHFEYDIQRPKPVESWTTEPVQLTWGQSRAFPAEPNKWKVFFDSFDGEHQEYVGPVLHRFLHVRVEGTSVVLSIPPAREIKY